MASPTEDDAKAARLAALRSEHADLDYAIAALTEKVPFDQVQVQRLKKRKLWLRDMIARLEAQGHPDLIA